MVGNCAPQIDRIGGRAPSSRGTLTRGEQQVAEPIAAGLTNQQIADRGAICHVL